MKNRTKYIIDILSALLICLFVYAAVSKILQHIIFNLVFTGLVITEIILDKRKDKAAVIIPP